MAEQWAKDAWARVQEDQRRADFLDFLFLQDGRDAKDHPLHSLYTGLYEQWRQNERSPGNCGVPSTDVLGDLRASSVSV